MAFCLVFDVFREFVLYGGVASGPFLFVCLEQLQVTLLSGVAHVALQVWIVESMRFFLFLEKSLEASMVQSLMGLCD